MNYRELLLDPRWQKKRLEIFERDQFTCRGCGDAASTLHVHHLRYKRGAPPWEANDRSLVTVCSDCHDYLHGNGSGSSMVEAMLAGGADIDVIATIEGILDVAFIIESTRGSRLTKEGWREVTKALAAALDAAQEKASS